MKKIQRELRLCACNCGGSFECKVTSTKLHIHNHHFNGKKQSKETVIKRIETKRKNDTLKHSKQAIKNISEGHKGIPSPFKGKNYNDIHGVDRAKELKKHLSDVHLGEKHTLKRVENNRKAQLGRVILEESVIKGTATRLAKNGGNYYSKETLEIMKQPRPHLQGENSSNWKGGITPVTKMIRGLIFYRNWVRQVFKRDGYTCQECGINRNLEAHHLKKFSKVFREYLNEYDQFSPIEDKETLVKLAIKYEPFWDINNGQTLCEDCHKLTESYARKV